MANSSTEGFSKVIVAFICMMFGGILLMYMVGSWDQARREANYHEEMSAIYIDMIDSRGKKDLKTDLYSEDGSEPVEYKGPPIW